MTGTTNKALFYFCLLMLIALSSATRELSPVLEGDGNPGDNKWTWKCIRLWDNYCIKNKKCEDKCQGDDGKAKGYHHGHCELWTCVCCKKNGEDGGMVTPPSRVQLGPEQ